MMTETKNINKDKKEDISFYDTLIKSLTELFVMGVVVKEIEIHDKKILDKFGKALYDDTINYANNKEKGQNFFRAYGGNYAVIVGGDLVKIINKLVHTPNSSETEPVFINEGHK